MNCYRLFIEGGEVIFVRASGASVAVMWSENRGKHVEAWEVSDGTGRAADTPIFDSWKD